MITQRLSLSLVLLFSAHAYGYQTGSVNHITSDGEMSKLLSSGNAVVVKFEADWCGPCKASRSPYEKMAQNHTDVVFAAVNVDKAQSLGNKYKVTSLPTIVVFNPQGKQVKRMTGFHSTDILNSIKPFEGASTSESAEKKSPAKKVEPKKEEAQPAPAKKPAAQAPRKEEPQTATSKKSSKCPTGKVTKVTSMSDLDDIIKNSQFVVAKFEADWCTPCKEAEEPYGYIAEDFGDMAFIAVDTSQNKDMGKKHDIRSLPTFVIFKNGKEVDRMVSFFEPALRAKIKDAYKGTKSAMAQINITTGPAQETEEA
jgi:thioredoxin 1